MQLMWVLNISSRPVLKTVVVCLVTGLFTLLMFAGAHELADQFFSRMRFTDLLYTPSLIADVLLGSGHLNEWYFWPTPQFFTEIPLYLPVHLFDLPQDWATLMYSALQGTYTLLLSLWLVWVISDQPLPLIRVLLIVVGVSALFLANIDISIYLPFYHYSSFLFGLLFLGSIMLLAISTDWRRTAAILAIIAVVGGLLGYSDFIFVAWVLLPIAFVALCGLLFSQGLRIKSVGVLLAVIVAIVIARVLWSMLEFKVDPFRYSRTGGELLGRLLEDPVAFCEAMALYIWIFIKTQFSNVVRGLGFTLFVLLAIPLSFKRVHQRLTWLTPTSQKRIGDFSIIALSVVGLNVLGFSHHDQQPERYMVAANYLPMIYVAVVLTVVTSYSRWSTGASLVALAWLGVALVRMDFGFLDFKTRPSSASDMGMLTKCLDRYLHQYGARRGISDWFQARPITELSRSGLVISPVHGASLKPFWWANSRNEFADRYDFALVHEPSGKDTGLGIRDWYYVNRERILRVNGVPRARAHCGDTEVLVYSPGELRVARKVTNRPRIPIGVRTQVYWRTPDTSYEESRSVHTFVEAKLGRDGYYFVENERIRLPLPLTGGDIFFLRIDPVDIPGFIRIDRVRLVSYATGTMLESPLVLKAYDLGTEFSLHELAAAPDKPHWWLTLSDDAWLTGKRSQRLPAGTLRSVEIEYSLDWQEAPDQYVITVKR